MTQVNNPTPDRDSRVLKRRDLWMVIATVAGPVGANVVTALIGGGFSAKTFAYALGIAFPWLLLVYLAWRSVNNLHARLASREDEAAMLKAVINKNAENHAAESRQLGASVQRLEHKCEARRKQLADWKKNEIRMIRPTQYAEILHRLADEKGSGDLLLFNVELNTFIDDDAFNNLWGKLVALDKLQKVRLALPPEKFARWENIVTGVRSEFFENPRNAERFVACRYEVDGSLRSDRIAFALYDRDGGHGVHSWGAVFLVNRPFVKIRDDGLCDYLHVLEYNGNHQVLDMCRDLWMNVYDPAWEESVASIRKFHSWKEHPPTLDEILREHNCDRDRAKVMKSVVGSQRVVRDGNKQPPPAEFPARAIDADGRPAFKLTYAYDPPVEKPAEAVTGYCLGIEESDKKPLPCIIWSSGFGDLEEPQLARLVNRYIQQQGWQVAQTFFAKSGLIEETTCTRTEEDISAVVDYISGVPSVDSKRICVVGISLSGYLATRLAARDHRIKSVVAMSPPFDVIQMLDAFRRHYLRRGSDNGGDTQRVPTFDDFMKARRNQRLPFWDKEKCCTYFNHTVRACHLVDIAVKGRKMFERDAFLNAIHEITQRGGRVAMVCGRQDPIAGDESNFAELESCVDRGRIRRDRFLLRHTATTHFFPEAGPVREYPFKIADARSLVATMAEAIQFCMGDDVCPRDEAVDRQVLKMPAG